MDPDAKRAAVGKVSDPLDADLDPLYDFPSPATAPSAGVGALTFSVEQLRAMLAAAGGRRLPMGVLRLVWRLVLWLFRAVSRWM